MQFPDYGPHYEQWRLCISVTFEQTLSRWIPVHAWRLGVLVLTHIELKTLIICGPSYYNFFLDITWNLWGPLNDGWFLFLDQDINESIFSVYGILTNIPYSTGYLINDWINSNPLIILFLRVTSKKLKSTWVFLVSLKPDMHPNID